jgi:NAD(P)-dependent dehydrogenase (short-subunit alcohol dehydrogenase family)
VDLKLRDKVAIVTGASKGIGLAVTKALVGEGVRVIAGARNVDGELGALAERGAVHAASIDLSKPDGPHALVAQAADYGGLDIVVNNVGALTLRLDGFSSVTDCRSSIACGWARSISCGDPMGTTIPAADTAPSRCFEITLPFLERQRPRHALACAR